MESISTSVKRVEAQEMISRFISKEDLYRHLTQHVGLFLPTMESTKISFLKTILCDEKKAFKNNEVELIDIPNYPEISVTNFYDDAMKDQELKGDSSLVFLALQERVISDREIIEEAYKKRYSISPYDQKKQGILISETWLAELKKHPFLSRKPGTGIFLMKERAKVHRERKSQTIHEMRKRLYKDFQNPDEMIMDAGAGTKRRNMGQSKPQEVEKQEKPNPFKSQFNM